MSLRSGSIWGIILSSGSGTGEGAVVIRKVAAAILAGGKASRYGGKRKELIELSPGVSIIERTASEIRKAGIRKIVICADQPAAYDRFGLPVLPDRLKNGGPLAGIESALSHFADEFDGVLFLPCDMPGVSAEEIGGLRDAFCAGEERIVIAETGDFFWHPLCSVVHIALGEEIRRAVTCGHLNIARLWKDLGAKAVHFDGERRFANINTPDDLEEFVRGGD